MDRERGMTLRLWRTHAMAMGYDWEDVSDSQLLQALKKAAEHYRRTGHYSDLMMIGVSKLGSHFAGLLEGDLVLARRVEPARSG